MYLEHYTYLLVIKVKYNKNTNTRINIFKGYNDKIKTNYE